MSPCAHASVFGTAGRATAGLELLGDAALVPGTAAQQRLQAARRLALWQPSEIVQGSCGGKLHATAGCQSDALLPAEPGVGQSRMHLLVVQVLLFYPDGKRSSADAAPINMPQPAGQAPPPQQQQPPHAPQQQVGALMPMGMPQGGNGGGNSSAGCPRYATESQLCLSWAGNAGLIILYRMPLRFICKHATPAQGRYCCMYHPLQDFCTRQILDSSQACAGQAVPRGNAWQRTLYQAYLCDKASTEAHAVCSASTATHLGVL